MSSSLRVDPGTQKSAKCYACGAQMEVERNVLGPTSWGEAMGGGGHLHDCFTCPNDGRRWHEKVEALIEEMEDTESIKIKSILKKEIAEILKTKTLPRE